VEEVLNPTDLDMPATLPAVDSTTQDTTTMAEIATAEEEDQDVFSTVEVLDTSGVNLREHLSGWEYMVWFRTDIALLWAYILLILTAIAAIIFPLLKVFTNPRGLIRLAAVLAGAAILVLIAYLVSSPEPIDIIGYTGESNRDPGTLRMVDSTLFVTYMLFGLALLSILYSIISRAFK